MIPMKKNIISLRSLEKMMKKTSLSTIYVGVEEVEM